MTRSIDPEYEVDGALILLGPKTSPAPLGEAESLEELGTQVNNPLLAFPSSLGTVAQALALSLGSQATRAELWSNGLEPSYVIGSDERSPILQFLVVSKDRTVALSTMSALMAFVEEDLDRRQDALEAPMDERIGVQRISADNEPLPGYGDRRRSQILFTGVGVLATLFLAVVVDVLVARARRRRTGAAAAVSPADAVISDQDEADGPPPALVASGALAGAHHFGQRETGASNPLEATRLPGRVAHDGATGDREVGNGVAATTGNPAQAAARLAPPEGEPARTSGEPTTVAPLGAEPDAAPTAAVGHEEAAVRDRPPPALSRRDPAAARRADLLAGEASARDAVAGDGNAPGAGPAPAGSAANGARTGPGNVSPRSRRSARIRPLPTAPAERPDLDPATPEESAAPGAPPTPSGPHR
ncbi:MAG: hypothetical protein GEV08_13085 [Acidimicrobiia bacterium]|nr:hypothetical protein [Acidimicrobiia bacterium]